MLTYRTCPWIPQDMFLFGPDIFPLAKRRAGEVKQHVSWAAKPFSSQTQPAAVCVFRHAVEGADHAIQQALHDSGQVNHGCFRAFQMNIKPKVPGDVGCLMALDACQVPSDDLPVIKRAVFSRKGKRGRDDQEATALLPPSLMGIMRYS